MRHSRACIKSVIDRSGQLVYAVWDTLVPIFIFRVLREGYKYFYIYTHTHKRARASKLTFQEKFSGYVRTEVHPLLDKPIFFFSNTRGYYQRSLCWYTETRDGHGSVRWRADGRMAPTISTSQSWKSFPEKPQGEEKTPAEHKAHKTRKGLGVRSKERKKSALDIAEASESWKVASRWKDQVVSSSGFWFFNFCTRLLHKITPH